MANATRSANFSASFSLLQPHQERVKSAAEVSLHFQQLTSKENRTDGEPGLSLRPIPVAAIGLSVCKSALVPDDEDVFGAHVG
ncbi:MAG: hypothetical protein LBB14_03710 [Puniceicoccales bacterium]|nr:hypothetical protein [Puniceicoccales bacterium]